MRVAIYQDYVHNHGSLAMALQDRGIQYAFFDADMIIGGALSMVDLLIMPGGADLYYCEKLNGEGNDEIRTFVENGGGYLGICAGAYYACTQLDWNKGEIAGSRELSFIDATATGPVFDYILDGDIEKSWYAAVDLTWGEQTFATLYEGGPLFDGAKDVTVYASYDRGAAVIGKSVGKGQVVLSSPHIEINADTFARGRYMHRNTSSDYELFVADELSGDVDAQNAFFDFILNIFKPIERS